MTQKQEPQKKSSTAEPKFLKVTTHKFKSNIARYIRMCERGEIKGVILMRYDQPVGVYIPYQK